MKKNKCLKWLAVSACLCTTAALACACGGNDGGDKSQTADTVTLDLFDTYTLDASALTGDVVWTSSDETVVIVADGVVTPVKEGSVEITATNGDKTVTYPVTVEDSGARPAISKIDSFEIYETKTYNLLEHLTTVYKDTAIMEGVTYSYSPVMGHVSVSEEGIVTGISEGAEQINVTATYRGYSIPRRTCSVTVLSGNFVQPVLDKISISTEENDVDPTYAMIEIGRVVVDAEEVQNADVTATVVSGEDFVTVEGLKVTAKAVGEAVIELSATVNGKTVTGTVTVNVHDDKVTYNPLYLATTGSGATATQLERVTEGEDQGAWKYVSQEGNYWQRALQDSSNVTQITQKGYKAITYQVKLAGEGVFSPYIPSALGTNSTVKYDLTAGKVTDDMELLDVLDENGESIKGKDIAMEQGKWYTFICDLTSYEGAWAFFGFTMGGTGDGEQICYVKDFNWRTSANLLKDGGYDNTHAGKFDEVDENVTAEKDELMSNMTFASAAAKIEKVVSGKWYEADRDTYKLMSKTSAYAGRFTFDYVHDGDSEPGAFFADGMHYISFEIFIESGSGLGVCNWPAATDGDESQKSEGTLDSSTTPKSFHVFNSANKRANLAAGAWYTVVAQVDYDSTPAWTLQWFGLAGSKYTPGVAYVRNVRFTKDMPVEEALPSEADNFNIPDGSGSVAMSTDEGFTDAVKYTSNSMWLGRLEFVAIADGSYRTEGYNYISFKFHTTDTTGVVAKLGSTDPDGTLLVAHKDVYVIDENNERVTELEQGKWYTVAFEWGGDTWCYLELQGSGTIHLKDLTYSKEWPLENYEKPEDLEGLEETTTGLIRNYGGSGTVYKVTNGEFAGTLKYVTNGNWWTGSYRIAYDGGNTYPNFGANDKYLTFKIYCVTNNLLLMNGQTDVLATANGVKVYNENGEQVTAFALNAWYTVVIDLGEATVSYFTFNTDAGAKNPIAYFKDITVCANMNEPELPTDVEYDTLLGFETAGTVEIQSTDESGALIADTFRVGTVTTEHAAKDNAVVVSFTKKNQQFRIQLLKADGSVYTAEELSAYSEIWIHVYVVKTPNKNGPNIKLGSATISSDLGGGAHVLKIAVSDVIAAYDEEGWLSFTATNGGQVYSITFDELIGIPAPVDDTAGGETEGESGGEVQE